MKNKLSILGLSMFLCFLLLSCEQQKNEQQEKWYKGNTHTHTTMSDGNETPEYVVNWYHEREYNFLVLTDHNKFVNPDSVKLPDNVREDFILIPGEEVTQYIHTTGLNINGYVHSVYNKSDSKTKAIQSQVDSILHASGIPILNHPNFGSGAQQVSEILPVQNLHMLEVFNGHPSVNNWGLEGLHISVEAKWDSLLSKGQKYYAVACDDAHHYKEFNQKRANPGRGWIMVKSTELSPDSIVSAMEKGDFYASNGVILKTVDANKESYSVVIDMEATQKELKSPILTGQFFPEGVPGFTIEFIGQGGKVLQKVEGTSATFQINSQELYVRCRASYCRMHSKNKYEKLYAWTQPVFI